MKKKESSTTFPEIACNNFKNAQVNKIGLES
jgi:hypothetical protein